ncbi:MAG: hypothetical protein HQK59_10040 [Deltaproteobacteria bacterium]|nr:hypothetical protein [Deltaproteobacteria bacterium]
MSLGDNTVTGHWSTKNLPPAVVQAINGLWHPDILDKLLINAVTAPSLEQFTLEMDQELARRAQLK